VQGLLGPELASVRPSLFLLLRRNLGMYRPGGHPESRSMFQLPTHLLLLLLQKATSRLNFNLPLCMLVFLTSPVIQGPLRYPYRLLYEGS
jgi:hypothetical protein